MKISFAGIGTQKGGTTSLNAYLRTHNLISIPEGEPHFFDDETQDWDSPDIASYHAMFTNSNNELNHDNDPTTVGLDAEGSQVSIYGEITPIYMYWEPSIKRIHTYNPDIKLIILLRNPMARAFSHWAMEKSRGQESLCFSDALRTEAQRCREGIPDRQHRVFSYLDRSRYSVQLKRILKYFPLSQMLILRSEELFQAPEINLHRITDFLGVPAFSEIKPIHARPGDYINSLSYADWRYMASELNEDITSVESLLGWDCLEWRQPLKKDNL